MPIHVKVVSAEDYSQWVAGEKKKLAAKADDPTKVWTAEDIIKRGEKVYAANCAACHQASGKGAGPIKPLDGSAIVLDGDHAKQIQILLNGKGAMPSWKQLSDTDLAAVISYTQSAALAMAPHHIRVNAIGPGPALPSARMDQAEFDKQAKLTLLGRGTSPEEISGAVKFILSQPSLTGQMIALDGGQHLSWQTPDVVEVNE